MSASEPTLAAGAAEAMRAAAAMGALHTVRMAGQSLRAAKRTRSIALIACATSELHAAVDAARTLGLQWGPIGSALGMARGNAYQRFRFAPEHYAAVPIPA